MRKLKSGWKTRCCKQEEAANKVQKQKWDLETI